MPFIYTYECHFPSIALMPCFSLHYPHTSQIVLLSLPCPFFPPKFHIWEKTHDSHFLSLDYLPNDSLQFHPFVEEADISLCQESHGCNYVSWFLGPLLYSVGLCWVLCQYHAILLLCLCSLIRNKVLWKLQCCSFCLGLLWLCKLFSDSISGYFTVLW